MFLVPGQELSGIVYTKREISSDVTSLKFESRSRTQSCTRSQI